jgi:hypothetical protein
MNDRPVCNVCGDAVGMYEPVVALTADSMHRSALAREPQLADSRAVLVHRDCATELGLHAVVKRPVSR